MKVATLCGTALAIVAMATTIGYAAKNPIVGGKEMFPNKNIVQNAVNSADRDARRGGESSGPGGHADGPRPIHGLRADERGVREAADRHRGHAAQARTKPY